jgi:hypothetical protein
MTSSTLTGSLDRVADLVHAHGGELEVCRAVAVYVADRAASLSLASAYASTRSALTHDTYLTGTLRLTGRQVRAWLALIRGTRTTRGPAGRCYGGKRGLIAALAAGNVTAAEQRRFGRLAHIAATGRPPAPVAAAGQQLPHLCTRSSDEAA